jgi:hypothetical protein
MTGSAIEESLGLALVELRHYEKRAEILVSVVEDSLSLALVELRHYDQRA